MCPPFTHYLIPSAPIETDEVTLHPRSSRVGARSTSVVNITRVPLTSSNKIQDSSTNLMSFLVDDLLDFSQLNAGKFRRTITTFDLKEAVEEVISIQKDKAKLMGVK